MDYADPAGILYGGEIVPYDFARPPRVSKDRRVALEDGAVGLAVATLVAQVVTAGVD